MIGEGSMFADNALRRVFQQLVSHRFRSLDPCKTSNNFIDSDSFLVDA